MNLSQIRISQLDSSARDNLFQGRHVVQTGNKENNFPGIHDSFPEW